MSRWILIVAALGVLTACNTVAGFGQDMKKVGQRIETKASK